MSLTDENTILILTNEVQNYNERLVEFDVIIEFNSEGKIIDRWSTWENFDSIKEHHEPTILDQPPYVEVPKKIVQGQISSPFGGEYDYYHLNSVQSIPANPNGVIDSRFKAGNWLISLRNVNVIAIISKDTREIVWSWKTGGSVGQHTTRMLENGNILFFENGGQTRNNYSRVIELNPVDKRIVWIYKGDPLKTFYSETEGSAQRLPNGNTLITESAKGRAFEITPKREIVWEWYNPDINEKGQRKTIHRMTRYSKEKIDILLEDEKRFHR